ncbi:hypothetical protein DXV75_03105 [Alteromonas aestuariivivens]|uniref:Nucleotide pyrophosphatase n=1 Tax=Alteromonas aestuariivivens TaxID=1938339 RepID=A0A3D8MC49_9ALTE|nr:alkaline phosphatase family protein [Alteromonas aestuariivivens]RDV27971.1 hypothetical protein DXV75_03105 [Alteromonas aestuariivivens]
MQNRSVFFVGLDAADKDLIEQWAAEGVLPHFAKLLGSSLFGDIEVPRGLEAGCVWPTTYFGLRPGNMGQYDGARLFDSKTYEHISYQPETDLTPPIWATLSQAGKRCAVVDAPYNYPVNNINGVKVVDRAGHVPAGGGNFLHLRTNPPELADEIVELFGPDPAEGKSSDYFAMDTVEDVKHFVDIYSTRIEKKTDMILHLWGKEPWDFFMSVFTEAHCAGHRCWFLHDPNYHSYNAELAEAAGNPLKEIYIALDKAIGRLTEAVKGDADAIVYLSHGMGPRHSGTRILDRMLARMDHQDIVTGSGWIMDMGRKVWRVMPEALRKPFLGVRNNVTNDGFQPNRHTRRFFEVYANDRTAGVRINLKGREANGVVEPEDYDELCETLQKELYTLINPDSGKPAVREVIKVNTSFDGPFGNNLPDLLVTWNRSHVINAIESPMHGRVNSEGLDMKTRTGDHRIRGRFFALSDAWQPCKLNENVRTEDFAPTIGKLLGVEVPVTDGRIIAALTQGSAPEAMGNNLRPVENKTRNIA